MENDRIHEASKTHKHRKCLKIYKIHKTPPQSHISSKDYWGKETLQGALLCKSSPVLVGFSVTQLSLSYHRFLSIFSKLTGLPSYIDRVFLDLSSVTLNRKNRCLLIYPQEMSTTLINFFTILLRQRMVVKYNFPKSYHSLHCL